MEITGSSEAQIRITGGFQMGITPSSLGMEIAAGGMEVTVSSRIIFMMPGFGLRRWNRL